MAEKGSTNICVVGASGLIGTRHVQHCISEPLVNLSCIVDPMPAAAELAKQQDVIYFETIDEMLKAKESGQIRVDGVILATPNATHVDLGLKMVRNGMDILVEKPLSITSESGRHLVQEAEKLGRKVLVGHHRRFNPYTIQAKHIISEGKLGRILGVQGVWTCQKPKHYFEGPTSWRKIAGSGGIVLINLVHDVDILRYLCGDVVKVYCQQGPSTRGFDVEETGALVLTFKSGAVGTFVFSDAVASPHNWEGATGENPTMPYTGEVVYTFFGTKGACSIPQLKVHHYDRPHGCWTDPMMTEPPPKFDDIPPFTTQLKHFVNVCRGVEEPNCSGMEGLKDIILLEAIKKSMRTGLPVEVPQE